MAQSINYTQRSTILTEIRNRNSLILTLTEIKDLGLTQKTLDVLTLLVALLISLTPCSFFARLQQAR